MNRSPGLAACAAVTLLSACATAGAQDASVMASPAASPSVQPSVVETLPAEATPSPNVQAGVVSEEGHFIGSWTSDPAVPPVNLVHEWRLHLETPEGLPVEGATVTVNGDMPAHGHGMPTQPEVTADLGGGDYRVEGMAFQMGGYWIVDVTVTADGETDLIRFGLALDE
jgi:hypothetical protein